MSGDYIHLKGVAGERKGNVQALGLWDTLPTCLGSHNQCRLLNLFLQDFFCLPAGPDSVDIENPVSRMFINSLWEQHLFFVREEWGKKRRGRRGE